MQQLLPMSLSEAIPDNCRACGLYRDCKIWKMRAKYGPGARRDGGTVDVLFVGQSPDREEDHRQEPFSGQAGQWLRSWTDALEGVSYAFTYAVKCAGNKAPVKQHIDACMPFLKDDLVRLQPKVVVALGAVALKALWPSGPSSLSKGKGAHKFDTPYGKIWLLVADHPINHIMGRHNLTSDYEKLFELIVRVLEGGGLDTTSAYDVELCMIWNQVMQAVNHLRLSPTLAMDFEFVVNKNDVRRLSLWHPLCVPLTVSFTAYDGRTFCFPLEHPESPYKTIDWVVEQGCWVPDKPTGRGVSRMDWKRVFEHILSPIAGQRKTLVGHSVKTDLHILERFYHVIGEQHCDIEDTLVAHFSIDQAQFGNDLGSLGNKYLGMPSWWDDVNHHLQAHGDWKSYADIPLMPLGTYNGVDTIATMGLYKLGESGAWDIPPSYPHMMRTLRSLRRVEVRGAWIDMTAVDTIDQVYTAKYGTAEEEDCEVRRLMLQFPVVQQATTYWQTKWDRRYQEMMHSQEGQLHGETWVIGVLGKRPGVQKPGPYGPKFISALAALTGLETTEKSKKTGADSYNATALREYAHMDRFNQLLLDPATGEPVVPWDVDWRVDLWRLIIMYRAGRTLLSTFIRQLKRFQVGGILRPNFNVAKSESGAADNAGDTEGGTESGRLATREPNLLNMKKDKVLLAIFTCPDPKDMVRQILAVCPHMAEHLEPLLAAPSLVMVKRDFKQMELRRMADFCGIQSLISAFQQGIDPYVATASMVLGIPVDQVTDVQRDDYKRNVLARIYLEHWRSLARRNKLDVDLVRDVDAKLSAAMPELDAAVAEVFARVDRNEVFETGYGRRRTFQVHEKRSAWNYPIQSECGDIGEQKFYELCEACFPELGMAEELMMGVVPFLLIHDAVLTLMPNDAALWQRVHRMGEIMLDESTLAIKLGVPLEDDIEIGTSWAKMTKVNVLRDGEQFVYRRNVGTKQEPVWEELGRVYGKDEPPF